jgi:hypothetical protein
VELAYTTTVAERTARFWSVSRRGGPTGPMSRLIRDANYGIVDFDSRRAIIRDTRRAHGLVGRARQLVFNPSQTPRYALFDDTSISEWAEGRWTEPAVIFQHGVPRLPLGLSFLDLLAGGRLHSARELGREPVHGVSADHYELTLDVNHIPRPQSGVDSGKHRPRLARLTTRLVPPRSIQRGVIPAEVWLDEHGRLVRFSHSDLPREYRNHDALPWTTTELWGFRLPPQIQDWRTQADPSTSTPHSKRRSEDPAHLGGARLKMDAFAEPSRTETPADRTQEPGRRPHPTRCAIGLRASPSRSKRRRDTVA